MATRRDLELAAARSLTDSCESIIGKEGQCRLPLAEFEEGKIDLSGFLDRMEVVFTIAEPMPKPLIVLSKNEDKKEFDGPV